MAQVLKWEPIETFPDRLDTAHVLWNPCDGVHLPNMCSDRPNVIRSCGAYSHWALLSAPEAA